MSREAAITRPRRVTAVALATAVAAAAWLALSSLDATETRTERRSATTGTTAVVARRTLVERETVDGTIGFGDARTVIHRDGGSGSSGGSARDGGTPPDGQSGGEANTTPTLTATARPGSVVDRGEPLYWVDGAPVVLMYGSTPAYRTLEPGIGDGPDVRQLEENLVALGFDPGTVDDEFSSTTAAAIRAWQDATGQTETGEVELGRVVVLPGRRRAAARRTVVGQPLTDGQEVIDTTSTRRVVKVELDVAKQTLVRRGDAVRVTLPDGTLVRGRIARIGRVARAKDDGGGDTPGGEASGAGELVIDMTVTLRSRRRIGRLDHAPVSVAIASEKRRRVLTVPVNALLARRGGGYAIELASSGRLIPVRTGMFADGLVEVTGGSLRANTRVRVAE